MVIDHHFGFIAFAWASGIIGFAGLAFWIWRDRKTLDAQLLELEAKGLDVSRAKDASLAIKRSSRRRLHPSAK